MEGYNNISEVKDISIVKNKQAILEIQGSKLTDSNLNSQE